MIKQGAPTPSFENADAPNAPGVYGLYQTIKGGNFSTLGTYNVQIDCYVPTNTSISGNVLLQFDVTSDGNSVETNNIDNRTKFSFIVFFFILAAILILFGIMKEDSNLAMLGAFTLFTLNLYTLINGFGIYKNSYTQIFSMINVGVAIYVAARCMEDFLSNLNKL